MSYPETSCFLICFSVSNPKNFDNIVVKWAPEVRRHCPNTPIILCATKIDLRDDKDTIARLASSGHKVVTKEMGEARAKEIGAVAYIETSALCNINLVKCFELVVAASSVDEEACAKRSQSLSKANKCSVQ